jgi:hypothetical protein
MAVITPVLKKHDLDKNNLRNYRPVSNLQLIGKLMEMAAASQLTEHLEKCSFLHPHQSAYRRGHSTETATLLVSNSWRAALDAGNVVCVASLDVTAAFDTVNHNILLARLQAAGVMGCALEWFRSYLSERSAMVKYCEARSRPFALQSGVPQGSVLGPILFNCYMSDLARKIESTGDGAGFHIYADDVLLFVDCSIKDLKAGVAKLQRLLFIVESWMKSNCLQLNVDKTDLFLLHRSRSKLPPVIPGLQIGDALLSFRADGVLRWLGVYFDPKLTMGDFINSTCRACFALLHMLRRIRDRLDRHSSLQLCHSLILSRVDYCVSLLAACSQSEVNKLQRVIHLAARTVSRSRRVDNVSPVLEELQWLPIAKRIEMRLATIVFKCLNSMAPDYLGRILTVYTPRRNLRCCNSTGITLELGTARTLLGRGAWAVAAPRIWNGLPEKVRGAVSLGEFNEGVTVAMTTRD